MKKNLKRLGLVFLVVILTMSIFSFYYLMTGNYSANKEAIAIYETAKHGEDYYVFKSNQHDAQDIVFYPGGKVDYRAYSILAKTIHEKGFNVYVIKMPFNLSIFNNDKVDELELELDDKFIIMGHSLGGSSASIYASKNSDKISGIIFLGSYPISDISKMEYATISLVGTNDLVISKEDFDKSVSKLPDESEIIEIDGGNHSQFGDYGFQEGDGIATITSKEQQEIVANKIDLYFNK